MIDDSIASEAQVHWDFITYFSANSLFDNCLKFCNSDMQSLSYRPP